VCVCVCVCVCVEVCVWRWWFKATTHLRDLPTLVISSDQRDTVRISHLNQWVMRSAKSVSREGGQDIARESLGDEECEECEQRK
jgi:hypothetical protein